MNEIEIRGSINQSCHNVFVRFFVIYTSRFDENFIFFILHFNFINIFRIDIDNDNWMCGIVL